MPFMRSESCSFIWHPKVVTWKRLAAAMGGLRVPAPGGQSRGGQGARSRVTVRARSA